MLSTSCRGEWSGSRSVEGHNGGVSTATDTLAGFAGFATALRTAGLTCDEHRVQAYLDAVHRLDVAAPAQVYWAGRVSLCADPDDLPLYDRVFTAWFATEPPHDASRTTTRTVQARAAALNTDTRSAQSEDDTAEQLQVAASDTEVLRHRDLAELTAAERASLRELIAVLRPRLPTRTSLRKRPASNGTLDPARTLRGMLAAGGEPVRLAYRQRVRGNRSVVLLIDVSGSMGPYADALLRFAHVLTRRAPNNVEVFTLGTRLTRVTRGLRRRDPEQAMLAAGRAVPDYAGGTRLGETLRVFLDRWGQRGLARGSVVVVFSDGWERGDVSLLDEQLARTARLAHRVFWVNPHAGKDGYAPVQSGIAAALPHLDRLLAGHSLATLQRLLVAIRDA